MAELIDFSAARFTPSEVKALGRVGIIRYVASGRPGISATKQEVDAFRSAGLLFVAVWQRGKDRALSGRPGGVVDAKDAAAYTAGLGAGELDAIHFSVDVDATDAQLPTVLAYFEGIAEVLGWHRVGVYGGIRTLEYLHERTPMSLFWQTASWSGGRLAPFATLYQYKVDTPGNPVRLNGKAVDFDRSLTAYYGQWGEHVNDLAAQSSDRQGTEVIWVVVHTAEGPTDSAPADPAADAGSAQGLLDFFKTKTDRSCHAIADDDMLLDNLVPYNRAAWTLRGGNSRSDNLELCGLADWPRSTWLQHPGMLNNAARWVASRIKARPGIPARFIGTQGVRDGAKGVIGHWNYTEATGDGTHWDPGPGFPWDYVIGRAVAYLTGTPTEEGFMAALTDAEQQEVLRAARQINSAVGYGQVSFEGTIEAVLRKVNELQGAVRTNAAIVGDDEEHLTAKIDEVKAEVQKLQPAPPPEPAPASGT